MKRNNEEHKIQAGIIKAVEFIPECKWLHAIPNGGNRDAITGAMLKAEGVKSGVADLFLPYPVGVNHGLYIEVKTPKGRLNMNQALFMSYARDVGYCFEVVRSVQEGVDAIRWYLKGKL
jgi:hypothetical protein